MIQKKRTVTIKWKLNYSVFEDINDKAFVTSEKPLGTTVKACNQLLARGEELRAILPPVVGMSPTDQGWQDAVYNYIHDMSLDVPKRGYEFDTSYTMDYTKPADGISMDFKGNIDAWFKEHPTYKVPEGKDKYVYFAELLDKVKENGERHIPEETLYRYVSFNNPADYMLYRLCLLSSRVANDVKDVNKSANIDFYLTTKAQLIAEKEQKLNSKFKVLKKFNEVLVNTDKSYIDNILISANMFADHHEIVSLTQTEKHERLLNLSEDNSDLFMSIVDDKQLNTRATIQKYIWFGLLKQIENTNIIVDAYSPEKVIGNSMDDAITFFNNELNKAYLIELKQKFNAANN